MLANDGIWPTGPVTQRFLHSGLGGALKWADGFGNLFRLTHGRNEENDLMGGLQEA